MSDRPLQTNAQVACAARPTRTAILQLEWVGSVQGTMTSTADADGSCGDEAGFAWLCSRAIVIE